jgi:TolA-binding protein
MATTVEPTTREQARATTGPVPWYRDRNRQLLAGGIAIAVIALVAWFVVTSSRRKEEFAAKSLNQARATAEAGNLPLASSELQRLTQTYKGTDAAREAVITLNQVRLVNGQSELAAVGLRDFLASKPPAKYASPAYGLLGAALENARKWSDAGDAFKRAAETADVDYLKAQHLVVAGRAYREAGKPQEAIAIYRTVIEKYSTASSSTDAQVRLAELTHGKM